MTISEFVNDKRKSKCGLLFFIVLQFSNLLEIIVNFWNREKGNNYKNFWFRAECFINSYGAWEDLIIPIMWGVVWVEDR